MKQTNLPLLGVVKARGWVPVPERLIAQCSNYRDAVRLCIQLSDLTAGQVADELGISQGAFNQILNRGGTEKRKRYLNPDLFGVVQSLCRNRAIDRYFAMEAEGQLLRQQVGARDQEGTQDLRAQLEEARAIIGALENQLNRLG